MQMATNLVRLRLFPNVSRTARSLLDTACVYRMSCHFASCWRLPQSLVQRQTSNLYISEVYSLDNRHLMTSVSRYRESYKTTSESVSCLRYYSKEVKKEKGGKKVIKPKIQLSDEELAKVVDFEKCKHQMDLVLEQLNKEYVEQLNLRTSAGVLDSILVETKEGRFPLIELAQVTQKNPQLLLVNVSGVPQYINEVKNALVNSAMRLNPQQDGMTLFVPLPKVTREHREGLAKNAKALCDKAKEKLRDIQARFVKDARKAKTTISEDLVRSAETLITQTSRDYVTKAEALLTAKQSELLPDNK